MWNFAYDHAKAMLVIYVVMVVVLVSFPGFGAPI